MPWKNDDGFFWLLIPEGQPGEILTLWAMQRGPGRGWSAGIDDGATNTIEAKWDHFTELEDAQGWCVARAVEWLKEGIAELARTMPGAKQ